MSYSLFLGTFQKRKLLNIQAFRDFPIHVTSHKTATMSCILRKTQRSPTLHTQHQSCNSINLDRKSCSHRISQCILTLFCSSFAICVAAVGRRVFIYYTAPTPNDNSNMMCRCYRERPPYSLCEYIIKIQNGAYNARYCKPISNDAAPKAYRSFIHSFFGFRVSRHAVHVIIHNTQFFFFRFHTSGASFKIDFVQIPATYRRHTTQQRSEKSG